MTPTAEQKRLLQRWRLSTFSVMLFGYVGYYLCRGNLSAALPLLSQTFSYTNSELGVILSVSELVYALGKFVTGPMADKVGGKRIFLVGMLGAVVFNLIFPLFSSILMFTIIWSLCRFFLSMGWGGVIKTLGAWYEPERNGTVMGIVSVSFQVGGGMAALYCGYLVSIGVGWQGLFIIPALTLTAIAVWSYFASRERPQDVIPNIQFGRTLSTKTNLAGLNEDDKTPVREILRTLFASQIFRYLLTYSFFITALRSIFIFWTAKFLVDIGMENSGAILKSAILPLFGAVGCILLGWYSDHYVSDGDRARPMAIMLTGLVASLFAIAVLIPFKLEYQNVIVFLLGLSGFFLLGPYSMASGCLALDIAGAKGSGTCSGMIDGVGYIGGALAGWGAGVLADHLGWGEVFYILSALAAVAVYSAFRLSAAYRRGSTEITRCSFA